MQREGEVLLVSGTHIGVWEKRVDEKGMKQVLHGLLGHLRGRGWCVERDPETLKHHPTIAAFYWYGRKGDLELSARLCGLNPEVDLYQNLQFENPNGGRYDFDKFERMPRHLRLPCVVELAAIVRSLVAKHGYALCKGFHLTPPAMPLLLRVLRACEGDSRPGHAAENPLGAFNGVWGADRFVRDETGWPALCEYDRYGQILDRDKRPLRNGETRYLRDRNGRLQRGVIRPAMNGMWTVVCGGSTAHASSSDLFSCERPDLERRRAKPGGVDRLRAVFAAAVKAEDFAAVIRTATVLQRVVPASEEDPRRGVSMNAMHRTLNAAHAAAPYEQRPNDPNTTELSPMNDRTPPIAKKMTREEAIALLRQFDTKLDAQPAYASRARAMPLLDLLRSMRGYVDEATLDLYLEAVETHGLAWADVHVDVYAIAAEAIVGGTRQ